MDTVARITGFEARKLVKRLHRNHAPAGTVNSSFLCSMFGLNKSWLLSLCCLLQKMSMAARSIIPPIGSVFSENTPKNSDLLSLPNCLDCYGDYDPLS